ncbi:MAG: acetyl/propionyl/methylcrotonyl-CoA carboxylase subunit alpha [Cohaesibacteraceae bacterium]|nr:acetyl/propionyl/methylcrotonyl-CoA carboxylase subunit alpha [Cohaesibacteraceae bacterium]
MFKKILVANRGEIACRVIKTAKRMGIGTVAVYSDADKNAVHVQMADEAVHIGANAASESYLVIDKIIDACRQTGAEAVHPGYGFLSENALFTKALDEAGIVFVGPGKRAIEVMGDKIQSKKFATNSGVSTVPGFLDVIKDADDAVKISQQVGYPVMIKASAGGGGKGMRVAFNDNEAREGFELATSEARNSFGDERCFIEKFIVDPRHIEIQVLGDTHGNVIYLGERECSIQRRNQKVIEEAPSSFLDEETRRKMGEQSVELAKAVDYCSAGTVEFIVDKDRNFYFLEMNTRLQVEHPVTELVTGVDLVEQMFRIAAGEELSIKQSDVQLSGWAIESRLYAEDPYRNFLPSTGRLVRYVPPLEQTIDGCTIRNDTGVQEGSEISIYYDPMIAKLCTHGPDRATAIELMSDALDQFVVDGIQHNIPFLSALMQHPRWISGDISTAFIADEYPDGFVPVQADGIVISKLSCVALSMEMLRKDRLDSLPGRLSRHSGQYRSNWIVKLDQKSVTADILEREPGIPVEMLVSIGGADPINVESNWVPGEMLWSGRIDDEVVSVQVRSITGGVSLRYRGVAMNVRVLSPEHARLHDLMPERIIPDTSNLLLCPMPGLVVSIAVKAGQSVQAGEALATVEAMKMENVLRAEKDLVVLEVKVKPGDSLAVDAVIMDFVV